MSVEYDDCQDNLNVSMSNSMLPSNKNIFFIRTLKFKNSFYSPGDDIALIGQTDLYARILLIAKVPNITFPVLLVSWYLGANDPLVKDQNWTHVSKRELIYTGETDWQYVQSVKGKIKMVTMQTYCRMDGFARTEDRLFFCRSYIIPSSPTLLNKLPGRVCYCRSHFNPDQALSACTVCGLAFHPRCGNNYEICIQCRAQLR